MIKILWHDGIGGKQKVMSRTSRKKFIESIGATCKNWQWSWSFINEQNRSIIFGEWTNRHNEGPNNLIFSQEWEFKNGSKRNKGYAQSKEHIRLIEEEGFKLLTFPIIATDESVSAERPRIRRIEEKLTEKSLIRVGGNCFVSASPREHYPKHLPEGITATMRYWWVNQNQTYNAEFSGGYIWSPKHNKDGGSNPFYETMLDVTPGDMIFSFRDTKIVAVGTAITHCYDAPKPEEFGASGANWAPNGWKVEIKYTPLTVSIRPKSHIDRIRPFLPSKYSPLQKSGDGLQSVYLAEVPTNLATVLLELLQEAGNAINIEAMPTIEAWTPDEIKAFVVTYLEIQKKQEEGEEFPSQSKYQTLADRFGRSRETVDHRLRTISYVLFLHGRNWTNDLNPANNVDPNVAAEIESTLAEVEDREAASFISFEAKVQSRLDQPNIEKPKGATTPKKVTSSSSGYERLPEVKAWVLQNANGTCENCEEPAPFKTATGQLFLEVHHVRSLGENGSDRIENAVAICPNCHRAFHHSISKKKMLKSLFSRIKRLVRE